MAKELGAHLTQANSEARYPGVIPSITTTAVSRANEGGDA